MDSEQKQIWLLAIAVSVVVTAMQFGAALTSDSIAIWADAFEGLLNVVTAVLGMLLSRLALRPADTKHPYGHGRLEFVGMIVEGVVISIIAWEVARSGVQRLVDTHAYHLAWYIAIPYGGTILINGWGSLKLRAYARKTGSGLAAAEAVHLRTDAMTTVVILGSVLIGQQRGLLWLDPMLALMVAGHILYSAWELISAGGSVLMDEALPEPEQKKLREIIAAQVATPVCGFHAVRTRRIGNRISINFHLVVDADLTVLAGHKIAHTVEDLLHQSYPEAFVTIHVEPEHEKRAGSELHPDRPVRDPSDMDL